MKHFVFLFYLLTAAPVFAQTLQTLMANNKVSIRGLSVVDDRIIWVSGSGGAVAKSLDSGKSWLWMTVKGFEKRDFRDIAAFDAKTAIIMAVAEPAVLLKTTDGGASWRMVFTDSSSGMFLDAMDFRDKDHGAVIGDPINKKLYLVSTADGGDHWTKPTGSALPFLGDGEAFFAASGTNL